MCGKFTQMASWQEVHTFSQPLVVKPGDEAVVFTPMRFPKIIRLNAESQRELVPMRWGFAGKNDPNPNRPKHMHARCETIDKLPTFKGPFLKGRGILMVHTFNEGEELPNGKTKQWTITPNDRQPVAIAVICEQWVSDAGRLDTFAQVTTPANTLITPITDRMPAILKREDWPMWLGEVEAPPEQVKALLQTFEDGGAWTMEPRSTKPNPSRDKPKAQQSFF